MRANLIERAKDKASMRMLMGSSFAPSGGVINLSTYVPGRCPGLRSFGLTARLLNERAVADLLMINDDN